MRQLIARIDDELHARLKAKAKVERRSMNSIVREAIESCVGQQSERERILADLDRRGWIVTPPPPDHVPTDEELAEATRGSGTSLSEALEEDRGPR